MNSHSLYYIAMFYFLNNFIQANTAYNPLGKSIFNRRHYLFDVVREEVLFGTENNIPIVNEEEIDSSFYTLNETDTEINIESEVFISADFIFDEFYKNVGMMFLLIRNDNGYFEHTSTYINALKKIDDDLPYIKNEYNRGVCINYLKICYESIYRFINFLNDEKKHKTPDIYQKTIDKIHLKLRNIDEFINLHKEFFDKIDLNLNFEELKDDILYFKELIDQEVKYFENFNEFRKENYQNDVSFTKAKIFEFLDIFRSAEEKIVNMSEDDFKDTKNPFNDDYIREITDFFKDIFINIKNYQKITTSYNDALNNIRVFEYRYLSRLKSIFESFNKN